MRILPALLMLPLAVSLSACQSWWSSDEDASTPSMAATSQPVEDMTTDMADDLSVAVASPLPGWEAYGAPIASAKRIMDAKGFAQVARDPGAFNGKQLRIVGVIEEVCQTKGCWMTFSDQGQTMRIKFTDYAFFMPKDCAGRQAIVDGVFSIQITPAEEAAHYLRDAGKDAEADAITEDVKTLNFMADSVLIMQG